MPTLQGSRSTPPVPTGNHNWSIKGEQGTWRENAQLLTLRKKTATNQAVAREATINPTKGGDGRIATRGQFDTMPHSRHLRTPRTLKVTVKDSGRNSALFAAFYTAPSCLRQDASSITLLVFMGIARSPRLHTCQIKNPSYSALIIAPYSATNGPLISPKSFPPISPTLYSCPKTSHPQSYFPIPAS
ncbi:hypothetical protein EJ07DRAFT_153784 [Lizonia empirigonia]|nr:hypothetical protein EJ07DRAFT_153784 [Lizonia empirigonia]